MWRKRLRCASKSIPVSYFLCIMAFLTPQAVSAIINVLKQSSQESKADITHEYYTSYSLRLFDPVQY